MGTPPVEQQKGLREKWGLPFTPTCLIQVDAEEYEAGARERLEPSGLYQSTRIPSFEIDGKPVEPGTFVSGAIVARWLLTSLVLTKAFWFEYGPVLRIANGQPVMETMPMSESRRPVEGVHIYRRHTLPIPDDKPFSTPLFIAIATLTEGYFRPVGSRMDRIAVAMASLWSSLCTPYPEQAYVSLSVALEALLSTQNSEVTHQLAERVAVLLGTEAQKPSDLYRRVKRLYGTRSDIVHGRGVSNDAKNKIGKLAKKDRAPVPGDYELYLHPVGTLVPMEELRDLTDLCVQLIRANILDDLLRRSIQRHDDSTLDRIYLDLLLGTSNATSAD